jgi:hypothetical protein
MGYAKTTTLPINNIEGGFYCNEWHQIVRHKTKNKNTAINTTKSKVDYRKVE